MGHFVQNIGRFVGRHKYLIAFLVFMLAMLAPGENSLMTRLARKYEIRQLEKEIEECREEIRQGERVLMELENDSLLKERLAREKYLMHRDDEDVFIEK